MVTWNIRKCQKNNAEDNKTCNWNSSGLETAKHNYETTAETVIVYTTERW